MFYTSFARPRQGYEFLNSDYLQIIIFPVPRRREVIHIIHNLRSYFFVVIHGLHPNINF